MTARQYRRENNLCTECGKPLDGAPGRMCDDCRNKRNERQRSNYKFYQSIGICPICRKNALHGSEKRCPECRAKNAESSSRRKRDSSRKNGYARTTYYRRKEAGICTDCGKRKAKEGHTTCEVCTQKRVERNRLARGTTLCDKNTYKLTHGLCVRCGKNPQLEGKKLCKECYDKSVANLPNNRSEKKAIDREKKNQRERETYKFYQQMGVCPRCRKNKLYGNEKRCPECRAKEAERSAKRKRSPEDISRWNKNYRQRLKDKGICLDCCKRKAEDGHTLCRICMDKRAEYQRIRRGTPLCGERNYRALHGICYVCGKNPCMDGKKVCTACYGVSMANLNRAMIVYKSLYPH